MPWLADEKLELMLEPVPAEPSLCGCVSLKLISTSKSKMDAIEQIFQIVIIVPLLCLSAPTSNRTELGNF